MPETKLGRAARIARNVGASVLALGMVVGGFEEANDWDKNRHAPTKFPTVAAAMAKLHANAEKFGNSGQSNFDKDQVPLENDLKGATPQVMGEIGGRILRVAQGKEGSAKLADGRTASYSQDTSAEDGARLTTVEVDNPTDTTFTTLQVEQRDGKLSFVGYDDHSTRSDIVSGKVLEYHVDEKGSWEFDDTGFYDSHGHKAGGSFGYDPDSFSTYTNAGPVTQTFVEDVTDIDQLLDDLSKSQG